MDKGYDSLGQEVAIQADYRPRIQLIREKRGRLATQRATASSPELSDGRQKYGDILIRDDKKGRITWA